MPTTINPLAPRPALRFPLQPVMNLTRCESYQELGTRLGVSGDAVRQWSVRGLSSKQADFVATKLGFHPLNIWESFNDDLVMDFEDDVDGDHEVEATARPRRRKRSRSTKPSVSASFLDASQFPGRN